MEQETKDDLRALISSRLTASLGTLHQGDPTVSMVPFAVAQDGSSFLILVSQLAQHTNDMAAQPRISLMITEQETGGTTPQALARITVQANAEELPRDSTEYGEAREAYLERHPQGANLFGFSDFTLYALRPTSARFIGGFARAFNISVEDLMSILSDRSS